MTNIKQTQAAIVRLRQDAIARGMSELAIAYGWSAIRLGAERIDELAAYRELGQSWAAGRR